MARIGVPDVLVCPRCEGRMRVLAFITDIDVAEQVLVRLGLARTRPPRAAATGPPQLGFAFPLATPAAANLQSMPLLRSGSAATGCPCLGPWIRCRQPDRDSPRRALHADEISRSPLLWNQHLAFIAP